MHRIPCDTRCAWSRAFGGRGVERIAVAAELSTTPPGRSSDPIVVLDDVPLSDDEARYVGAARSVNTMRGYRSDWNEWCAWCDREDVCPLPVPPEGISRYLTFLAGPGSRVGTMSRRLSAIRFAHHIRNLKMPRYARVFAVWEGIRGTHGAPPSTHRRSCRPNSSTSSRHVRPCEPGNGPGVHPNPISAANYFLPKCVLKVK
jgi:hypothetical protein